MKRTDARRVLIVLRGTERRAVEAAAKRARLPLATWARVAAVNAAVISAVAAKTAAIEEVCAP